MIKPWPLLGQQRLATANIEFHFILSSCGSVGWTTPRSRKLLRQYSSLLALVLTCMVSAIISSSFYKSWPRRSSTSRVRVGRDSRARRRWHLLGVWRGFLLRQPYPRMNCQKQPTAMHQHGGRLNHSCCKRVSHAGKGSLKNC